MTNEYECPDYADGKHRINSDNDCSCGWHCDECEDHIEVEE